jgi:hypothetical protein
MSTLSATHFRKRQGTSDEAAAKFYRPCAEPFPLQKNAFNRLEDILATLKTFPFRQGDTGADWGCHGRKRAMENKRTGNESIPKPE